MEAVKRTKKRSQIVEVWKRFRKNPIAMAGLGIIIGLFVLAAMADIIAPAQGLAPGYDVQNLMNARQFPGDGFIFGTDHLGRDIFARIAHGARVSLMVGFIVVTISMTVGVTLGSIAGFYGGIIDNVIMRLIDIVLAIPALLMAIAIAAALGPGLVNVMIAVGLNAIPSYARIVRAQVLQIREQEFVEAARSLGANDFRLIRKHILPNCMAPIIVEATMGMAMAIAVAAALSFIGVGLQPPVPEWGAMLSDARRFMLGGYWHMTLFPGLAIALVIFALNMIGDGLRDAFDPKLRSATVSKKRFEKIRRTIAMEAAKS
ncbi:MAG: ABC transporter permease [Defluviitaleaceae bacterium]|nr:ABC transporter permease [Defluviitaleaceae bacterium]